MTKQEIDQIADDAANAAVLHVQDVLKISSGDFAGLYFSGDRWDALTNILADYITAEISEGIK